MKRITIFMLFMASAAVISCQKKSFNTAQEILNEERDSYVFTISASSPEDTKSNYDEDGKFQWSTGDAISVLFHDNTKEGAEKNKFFTLELVSGAGSNDGTFRGTITSGYTIGASDGTSSDKKIWALFPASSSHTYTEGESYPKFYVQPEVDFSATHFSANIPMYALNAEEGDLSFINLASTYKFTVSGIKEGVSKVSLTVYNKTTFGLSGLWPIANDGKLIVNYGYASVGSAKSTLTYTSDVTSNQAVFYVSCHGTYGTFQPNITVTNCATGLPIKVFSASKSATPNDVTTVKRVTLDVSDGFYTPVINIDGDFDDWDPSKNTALTDGTNYKSVSGDGSHWKEFKVAYDAMFMYFYMKRDYNAELWDTGYFWLKFDNDGDADYDDIQFYIQPFKTISSTKTILASAEAQDKTGTASSGFSLSCAGSFDETDIIIEAKALRSDIGIHKNDVIGIRSNANKSAGNITISGTLTVNN